MMVLGNSGGGGVGGGSKMMVVLTLKILILGDLMGDLDINWRAEMVVDLF